MTRRLEDAWPVQAAVYGAAIGLSLAAAGIVVAEHLARKVWPRRGR